MNDHIKPIIDEIKKNGYKALEDIIARKDSEKYFIDFKLTQNQDYTNKKTLFSDDKKNFAKAISGFGNSEGGIIIWGIDASGKTDDYAKSIKPILGIENFESLLESFVSLLTIPSHNTVESFSVKKKMGDNRGVVVTIIPKGNDRPYQVINKYQYYIRVGDSFKPIPHGILKGMFGQTPQPDVFWMYNVPDNPTKKRNIMTFQLGLMAVNGGLGIGEDIYGYARVWSPGKNCLIGIDLTDQINYDFYKAYGIEFSFMSKKNFRLGHDQRSQMMVINFQLVPPFEEKLYISLMIGGRNQRVYKKIIETDPEQLSTIYEKFIKKPDRKHVEKILNLN